VTTRLGANSKSTPAVIAIKGRAEEKGQRLIELDGLRGITIVLVVIVHTLEVVGLSGDPVFGTFAEATRPIRMPLFAIISGFIFSKRSLWRKENVSTFLQGRLRRLGPPFLLFSIFLWLFTRRQESRTLWESVTTEWNYLWYLQANILISLFIAALMLLLLRFKINWIIVTLVLFSLHGAVSELLNYPKIYWSGPFAIFGALYLAPYFTLGLALKGNVPAGKNLFWTLIGVLGFFGLTVRAYLKTFHVILDTRLVFYSSIILAVLVGLFLIRSSAKIKNVFLTYLGARSYQIYLLHIPFLLILERFTPVMPDFSKVFLLIAYVAFCLLASLVVEKSLINFGYLRFLLWGDPLWTQKKSS
jgi:peptidoglycan/LPS O-acetylase OafA/YrhL